MEKNENQHPSITPGVGKIGELTIKDGTTGILNFFTLLYDAIPYALKTKLPAPQELIEALKTGIKAVATEPLTKVLDALKSISSDMLAELQELCPAINGVCIRDAIKDLESILYETPEFVQKKTQIAVFECGEDRND